MTQHTTAAEVRVRMAAADERWRVIDTQIQDWLNAMILSYGLICMRLIAEMETRVTLCGPMGRVIK